MRGFKWFIINYLALTSLLTVISVVSFRLFLPAQYPPLLFLVPVFFVLMLGVMVYINKRIEKKGKPAYFFIMIYRPVRLLLLMLFVLAYIFLVRTYIIPFLSVFAIFYVALLVYETIYLMKSAKTGVSE